MQVRIMTNSSDDIHEAIACLSEATILALDCEGVDLGRSGEICVIQLSTKDLCFLFDVHELTASCELVVSLKTILEDENIIKIIHDCKMDSDALFHKFGIKLTSVHDTQVWDKVLNRSESNLNNTLRAYGCIPNVERNSDVYKINFRFWAMRPMTAQMIEWAAGDVTSLFELHSKQLERATSHQRIDACVLSESNASFLRECVMLETRISVHNMGRFIGPGGSNLQYLMRQVPGIFFQCNKRGSGLINIYGLDQASVERLDRLVLTRYR
jgi:ribonuclease D